MQTSEPCTGWSLDLEQIRERVYEAERPRERERWHAIWLVGQGWSQERVATALGRDPQTIGSWLEAFRQRGRRGCASIGVFWWKVRVYGVCINTTAGIVDQIQRYFQPHEGKEKLRVKENYDVAQQARRTGRHRTDSGRSFLRYRNEESSSNRQHLPRQLSIRSRVPGANLYGLRQCHGSRVRDNLGDQYHLLSMGGQLLLLWRLHLRVHGWRLLKYRVAIPAVDRRQLRTLCGWLLHRIERNEYNEPDAAGYEHACCAGAKTPTDQIAGPDIQMGRESPGRRSGSPGGLHGHGAGSNV